MTVKHNDISKPRVVALGNPVFIGQQYLDEFSQAFNFSILEARDRKETQERLPLDIVKNGPIDAFIIRMGTPPFEPFDEDLLRALAPNCQIITSASAGYNEFDIDWMTRSGIHFCNTVDAVAEATADMAIYLILATLRNTLNAERSMRNGTWRGGLTPTRDPSGLTLGIVGMGAIGKYLAKKALAFNMKVKYFNRTQLSSKIEAEYDATYCSTLQELLSCSDVVSTNCPYNKETEGLIGKSEFDAMKNGVFFHQHCSRPDCARRGFERSDTVRQGLESRSGRLYQRAKHRPVVPTERCVHYTTSHGRFDGCSFSSCGKGVFRELRAFFSSGVPNSPVNVITGIRK